MLLASKLASMMLMVVVGFAIVRLGIMKVEDSKPISTLIVFVLTPCLIIRAFQIDLTPARLEGFFASVLFMAASYVVWILLAKLLKKLDLAMIKLLFLLCRRKRLPFFLCHFIASILFLDSSNNNGVTIG